MIDNYSKSSVFSGSNKNAINCSFNSVRILCPTQAELDSYFCTQVSSCDFLYIYIQFIGMYML